MPKRKVISDVPDDKKNDDISPLQSPAPLPANQRPAPAPMNPPQYLNPNPAAYAQAQQQAYEVLCTMLGRRYNVHMDMLDDGAPLGAGPWNMFLRHALCEKHNTGGQFAPKYPSHHLERILAIHTVDVNRIENFVAQDGSRWSTFGYTPLTWAIAGCQLPQMPTDFLRELIKCPRVDVNKRDTDNGEVPLALALEHAKSGACVRASVD